MLFLKVHQESSYLMEPWYRKEAKDQLIISLEPLVSSPTRDNLFSSQLVSLLFQLVLLELSSPMVRTYSLYK